MLEIYSENITVGANSPIPFNNVSIKKGCTAVLSAPATVQFNKCGVYMVSCDASINPTATGEVEIQLYKNGIPQPQAQSIVDATTGEYSTLHFTTLVQVPENNTSCCCSSPTTVQIINSAESSFAIINVCVTKIC